MEYEIQDNMNDNEKQQLKSLIRQWIVYDNEIKELTKLARERREKKKELNEQLISLMKTYEIDCLKTKQDGMIVYSRTKTKSPLNKKHLLNALTILCKNDEIKAKEMSQFILDTREDKIRETIKRKI